MLRLMLFRHAHADHPAGIDDHARPLSSRGLDESRRMGAHLATQSLVPELAIVSTARRTQETWHAASESGGFHVEKIDEPRIYESSAGDLLEVVRAQDPAHKRIMLVGHNPGMERLTAWLVQSGEAEAVARLQREFAVGGLAVLDFEAVSWAELDVQSGHLQRFDTPRSLAS
ncbi:MAG TPA: histidine phosphatase family protein [Burkholderiaceae bacterium]|nr:histidine phosphatase family protein [Burkholderiaceae bacterium]